MSGLRWIGGAAGGGPVSSCNPAGGDLFEHGIATGRGRKARKAPDGGEEEAAARPRRARARGRGRYPPPVTGRIVPVT